MRTKALIALAVFAVLCRDARAQARACEPHRTRSELIGAAIGAAWIGGSILMKDDTHRIESDERMRYLGLVSWAGVLGATFGSLYENRRCPGWMRPNRPDQPTNCAVAITRGTASGSVVGGTAGLLIVPLISLPLLPMLALDGGTRDRFGKAVAIGAVSGVAVGAITGAVRQYRAHCAR